MTTRLLPRLGLLFLAIGQLGTGVWAILRPQHWFETFPPGRPGWVVGHDPYNHHLAFDAGTGFLATGVALLIAALWPYRQLVLVAATVYLSHAVPHLVFHLRHPATDLPVVDQTLEWLTIAAGIVIVVISAWYFTKTPRQAMETTDTGSSDGIVTLVPKRPRNPLLFGLFTITRWMIGFVPDPWRALAHTPAMLFARACGDVVHASPRHIPESLANLATLRAATLVECEFCIDLHSAVAAKRGIDERKVRDLTHWPESEEFDETERLVLAITDAMSSTPGTVPQELVEQLRDELGEKAVIELSAIIGHENGRARANRVMGIPPQGFATADSCTIPGSPEASR